MVINKTVHGIGITDSLKSKQNVLTLIYIYIYKVVKLEFLPRNEEGGVDSDRRNET
jgi:hypothetical protein